MSVPLVVLGPIRLNERDELFDRFAEIVEHGEGFPQAHPLTRQVFEDAWVHPVSAVVVARVEDHVAGAYYLKPNYPGRAAHIANAGYFVAPTYRRRGIGRMLIEDSIKRAPHLGFDAIQFNLVFESNPAGAMYEALGWSQVGRIPNAVEGEDAIVYWRSLRPSASHQAP